MLIFLVPSVIKLWYNLGTLFIPPLLLPLLAAYFPGLRQKPLFTFGIMLLSFLITAGLFIFRQISGAALAGVEPFFPGMLLSLLGYGFMFLKEKITASE